MTTGEKIQTLRKKQGLTQEQLAQGLGVSRQAVSRWELDEALPETANLLPLAKALGCSIDWLRDPALGWEGPAQGAVSPSRENFPHIFLPLGKRPRLQWLWLLPLGLVVLAFLGIGLAGLWGSGGQFPTLAWIVLVQGLNLCFWFYLLCLAVYALVLLSRYLKRKTS